jgi:hypothetical protein
MLRKSLSPAWPLLLAVCLVGCDDDPVETNQTPQNTIINLAQAAWHPASVPLDEDNSPRPGDTAPNSWYNIAPEFGIHRRDLDPALDEQENTLVPSLDLELDSEPNADDTRFAGVMSSPRRGGLDVSDQSVIEIWVNDFKPDPVTRGGTLHIDVGTIDEGETVDVDGDGEIGRVNAYYTYQIDLAAAAAADVRSAYPAYEGFNEPAHINDSWRLYRAPLADFVPRALGTSPPPRGQIRHVRIWFEELDDVFRTDGMGRLRVQIAEFVILAPE